MTGLSNRRHTRDQLHKIITACTKKGGHGAYMVLGIDNLSLVTDAIGLEAADALLRGVARRLERVVPEPTLLGRVGGDTFGIAINNCPPDKLSHIASVILHAFRNQPIETPERPLHISVSLGGVVFPREANTAVEAMIRADQALREARTMGRSNFVEYKVSPERQRAQRNSLDIGEKIQKALKNDGLKLAYQPVICGVTGKPLFYEVLVRMIDDSGNTIPAADFIPVVEQLGMITHVDFRVLDLALAEMHRHRDLSLAVNVSGLTASLPSWPQHMQSLLSGRPDIAGRLIIEITETAAVNDITETARFVNVLRNLGGSVALDDFGSGSTSIRHLRTLAVEILKLDRELVWNVAADEDQQVLVRMLIGLARGLGLRTVAEGVETEEVAAWLINENVDLLQGYLLGRPSLDRLWLDDDDKS